MLERVAGIEPASSAWKAEVLPLNYTRGNVSPTPGPTPSAGNPLPPPVLSLVEGGGFEPPKLARQIYSLIPLATREPLRKGAHSLDVDTLCQQGLRGNSALLTALANAVSHCVCANCQAVFRARVKWSWREESNPRPADYKSAALPTELRQLKDVCRNEKGRPGGERIIPSGGLIVKRLGQP